MTRPGSVLAVGGTWSAVALACSTWLVPLDGTGGFYLVDHGRIEHYGTRLAAVTPFVALALFALGLAAVIVLLGTRLGRAAAPDGAPVPAAALVGSALPMLLAGFIPLSVVTAARGDIWPTWLVLVVVVLAVLALSGVVVRTVRRAQRATGGDGTH